MRMALKRGGTAGSLRDLSSLEDERSFLFSEASFMSGLAGAVYPSLEQARELAKRGNLIPVYREVLADMETPVSVYRKVARGKYSFLLESVEGGERLARYSFIGTEPRLVVRLHDHGAVVTTARGEVSESRFSDPLDFV